MKLASIKTPKQINKKDVFIFFISNEAKKTGKLTDYKELQQIIDQADLDRFKANTNEKFVYMSKKNPAMFIIGLGEEKKINDDILRNAGSIAASLCREYNISEVYIVFPLLNTINADVSSVLLLEGITLANYSFEKYRNIPADEAKALIKKVTIIIEKPLNAAKLREIEIISANTVLCRDLVNDTSEESNPVSIAREAQKLTKIKGVACKVFGKKEIERMKMGLLLAVNKGSKIPPQFVVLSYKGDSDSKKSIALVGKGVTFDSGGVNLKPSGHIETMRMDMGGAAAVLYAFKAAAELKIKKNIYAVIPLTENMISSDAYRPGDIFTSYSGKTVEIGNTDAEGRLILADALAYTAKNIKPQYIIDIATLTGACLVAFGETVAAYLTNDEKLGAALEEASESSGDKIWKLPLYIEYEENLKSEIADIVNVSAERNAGTIVGATFLKNFIDEISWAHIDIAGTAWYSKQRGYRPKNATGFGVKLLIDLLKNWRN